MIIENSTNIQTTRKITNHKYHHGDLHNVLLAVARAMLEEQKNADLSLRAIARRAGVSHAAPYRHFENLQGLLAELAKEGFFALRQNIETIPPSNLRSEQILSLCRLYTNFVVQHPALVHLMFGTKINDRSYEEKLCDAIESLKQAIGNTLNDQNLGVLIWSMLHGMTMFALGDIIDLGQRTSGLEAFPMQVERLLNTFVHLTETQQFHTA